MLTKFRMLLGIALVCAAFVQADAQRLRAPSTGAMYVDRFDPQGEVKDPQHFTAQFNDDVVKLGDANGPVPFDIQCPVSGTNRWENARSWSYTLKRPLNPGERCHFTAKVGLRSLSGKEIRNAETYVVSTPGPWVESITPSQSTYEVRKIEEDQVFLLDTRLPVNAKSVAQFSWCEAEGVGERIPVSVLSNADYAKVIKASDFEYQKPTHGIALQCSRPLPTGMKMKLVWGRGIQAEGGAKVLEDSVFSYQVRTPFTARFGCDRERANMPCSPLSNLWLEFSENISTELANKIRLVGKNGEQRPEEWSAEYRAARKALGHPLPDRPPQREEDHLDRVTFKGPFPPNSEFTVVIPKELKDLSGRPLSNAAQFPLKTRVAGYPPLAKFAAGFGILEKTEGGVLPVTLRNVEANLKMRVLHETTDAAMLKTWADMEAFEAHVPATQSQESEDAPASYDQYYPRELSYLAQRREATVQNLPKPNGEQAFEVVGIPLQKPGFYVVEIESQLLGSSLLKTPKPMYVRSQALVTDMSVHFKKGRDNSLVWVTSLVTGKGVPNADVHIYGCNSKVLAQGKTDALGRMLWAKPLPVEEHCDNNVNFVTARLGEDFSFVRSDWDKGIEPWRYNLHDWDQIASPKIHTVLDRSLFRAGETVSMKHIARLPKAHGFSYPNPAELPQKVTIQVYGSDEEIAFPLVWDARGIAITQWKIPESAKLGVYSVQMGDWNSTAEFRVSEFRLPKFKGAVQAEKHRVANVKKVPINLSLSYLNGGVASGQQVQLSGLLSGSYTSFPRYRDYSFGMDNDDTSYDSTDDLVMDKQVVTLSKQGTAQVMMPLTKLVLRPMELRSEMTFNDPNGEVQTIAGVTEIWPAEVMVGAQINDAENAEGTHALQAIVLNMEGKPREGVQVSVMGEHRWEFVHRKRILGGFYSYETEKHRDDLGTLCSGKTNQYGVFRCAVSAKQAGAIKLKVLALDGKGGESQADLRYYNSSEGDFWFDQQDQDRMDVIPEKHEYQPGEIARFQVRTPFHDATALITVEREGIVESFVRPLHREDATIEIPVGENWGPNVFVSVLAVRGRVREVPWYSFFQWGWHTPTTWWNAWRGSKNTPAVTAMVDLAKPAFKLGIVRLDVGIKGARLKVEVTTDKTVYAPRGQATVKIRVRLPNGKPAPAGSEVMVAAVDQALLELAPNPSWDLLEDMMQERGYMVATATAQMQVIGKRHFGKKALPAGGGGGRASSRELFDTLLFWQPRVKLDAQGMATLTVPLNDSLTAFKIVAVADVDTGYFGTGSTEITSTQDVQLTAGVPPLVREGDHYLAMMSVRNVTKSALALKVQATAGSQTLPVLPMNLAGGEAQELSWSVTVPSGVESLPWQISVVDAQGKVWDSLKFTQKIQPRVPVTTQQAMFMRLEQPYRVATSLPDGALAGQGGIAVQLSAKLADQTEGMRQYFLSYPYSCLEQKVSIAAGLQDAQRWADISQNLSGYLDASGLAQYFPGAGRGSPTLTGYVLVMADEQGIKLPEAVDTKMQRGLLDFAEGRTPKEQGVMDLTYLTARRLQALEALSHRGLVTGRMLTAFEFKPNTQSTLMLIDWYSLLHRVADAPQRAERLAQVERELRNRLSYAGGRMMFSSETRDNWWWMMANGETNALRLLNVVMEDPAWKDDLPALLRGALLRQSKGSWSTTVGNVWGSLALKKFSAKFERETVTGVTTAQLGAAKAVQYHWDKPVAAPLQLPWQSAQADFSLSHQGSGSPWATVMLRAAIPGKQLESGYRIQRTITPIDQKVKGQWSRGDLMRVRVDVDAGQAMKWVALSDPIPSGASIMGNTARDSQIAQQGENRYRRDDRNDAWASFTERGLGFFRAYYETVPKGHFWFEYTLRLNNPGEFSLPPTRVEAMYAPELFGQFPNDRVVVK
ncbi:MAG: MG2 domain-containing protein [Gallionella sp.]|nr:MG2 domain-containing protein [Gallionella sp.]MDD4958192.1 MG2 domain-containing protein [Gallionella sp.]